MSVQETVAELRIVNDILCDLYYRTSPITSQSLALLYSSMLLPQLDISIHAQILDSILKKECQLLSESYSAESQQEILSNPPPNDLCLKMLLLSRDFHHFFKPLEASHISVLVQDVPPMKSNSDCSDQEAFIIGIGRIFTSLSSERIHELHQLMLNTKRNLEYKTIKSMIAGIPNGHINTMREVFRLDKENILNMKVWITTLDEQFMPVVIRMLQMDTGDLMNIKKSFNLEKISADSRGSLSSSDLTSIPISSSWNLSNSGGVWSGIAMPNESMLEFQNWGNVDLSGSFLSSLLSPDENSNVTIPDSNLIPMEGIETSIPHIEIPEKFPVKREPTKSSGRFHLHIRTQPPPQTVYQRILKPHPSLTLDGDQSATENLYVEAIVIRGETEDEVENVLDGTKTVQIRKNKAQFSKLKLTQTSQMKGTFFRLKFMLKIYDGKEFQQEGTYIISNPIEVFSHSQYLTSGNSKNPAPPMIKEILPAEGLPQCRVVILGNNFVKNNKLLVRFGTVPVTPEFHEQGTLICNAPTNFAPGAIIPVTVANDSVHYCKTRVNFTFKR